MDLVEKKNKAERRRWAVVVVLAALGVFAGVLVGFVSRALEPVAEFAKLPPQTGPDAKPLPKVYWLRQYTATSVGAAREKEIAIKAGAPASLNDREMGLWINRTFSTDKAPTEDLDAVAGAAFVRLGGQRPGDEADPVLTVTMPFKLKLLKLPVSDVNLQFVAKPRTLYGETVWDFSEVRVGHARVPGFVADKLVPDAVVRYMRSTDAGAAMLKSLANYRSVTIRDGHLSLASPLNVPAKAP